MFSFLIIASVVFWVLSKFYVIAKKNDATGDWQSFLLFAAFMFICTVLWLMMKFAFRSSFFILLLLLFWPNIKRSFKDAA